MGAQQEVALALCVLASCGGASPESPDAGRARDASRQSDASGSDEALDDASALEPPSSGDVRVESCAGMGGIDETCGWRWLLDPAQCAPEAPCSKLVAFFAGGEQDCGARFYDGILEAFAGAGYLAACLTVFETAEGSGSEPYVREADRVDRVLADLVGSDLARAVWDGQDLLLAGVSHGATVPVAAMARTSLDDAAHWHGSRSTAACFFDGIYDIAAFDELMGTGAKGGRPCLVPIPHTRVVGRYYDRAPREHSCDNDMCWCDPDHAPAMDDDTVRDVAPEQFAIADWKLIECGSDMAPCTGDIVPGEPIEALCASLDSSGAHRCTFESMPNDGHITCAAKGIGRCLDWFDSLPR